MTAVPNLPPDPAGGLAAAWRRAPGYLDTATFGLPPRATTEAVHRVVDEWSAGTGLWRSWNDAAGDARRLFAAFVGVAEASVAVGFSTSSFVGLVAASLPDTAEVVVPEEDFTSLLFPFLVQEARGVVVRTVPLDALADSVTERTTVVAWSAVQSADGRLADTESVLEAAARVGALTVVDTTQATGWYGVPVERIDAVVCSAYKWLCCPRGTAFMIASTRLLDQCRPHAASWYAADDVHGGYYGPPLRLAGDARRLNMSPAWFAWVGAVTSLTALAEVGLDEVHAHDVGLADGLREALGMAPTGSAIVSIAGADVEAALAARGIKAATRANGCRLAFHLYNDHDDVAAAVAALRDTVSELRR